MSISDKIIQLNQVKQDIKQAIEDKGVAMSGVPFTNYPLKISEISGGGGMTYEDYARTLYLAWGKSSQFATAWQKQIDSKNVIYDIDVTLVAPNQEFGEMVVDLYTGDSDLTQLYNDCVNEVIPLPSSGTLGDIYLVNSVAVKYFGDLSAVFGFPFPLFVFGYMEDVNVFFIGDLTPLGMGLGITLVKITSVTIPNNKLTIQQGFDFEEPSGIILPDSVTSIDDFAFQDWKSNNQPLVLPNSLTSIGDYAFSGWTSNNQPLVIPNSVTEIGESAFSGWTSNNQPLVIPNSVTNIGDGAFYNWQNIPYVEMKSATPPTISSFVFSGQNNAPIYVPDESVDDYKTATNWSVYASRIFPISEK